LSRIEFHLSWPADPFTRFRASCQRRLSFCLAFIIACRLLMSWAPCNLYFRWANSEKRNGRLKAKDFHFPATWSWGLRAGVRLPSGWLAGWLAGKNSAANRTQKVGLLFKWISLVSEIKMQCLWGWSETKVG